jgi:hypothetical protein
MMHTQLARENLTGARELSLFKARPVYLPNLLACLYICIYIYKYILIYY